MKIYLETSVPSFLFADDAPEKMKITKFFFKNVPKSYELFISDVLLQEIDMTKEPKRSKILYKIHKYKLNILNTNDKTIKLSKVYIKNKIIPEKYENDALHIALAVINKMDIIVSWNMRHIVRMKTIVGVNKINKELGLKEILIYTPEEVLYR